MKFARALFVMLALCSAGCGRFTRTKQCRKLIAQVNPALDEVQALTSGKASSASYVAAAARYERLSKTLGPMEFSSEQMAKTVAEYASVLSACAQNLRALAAALDTNNNAEAEHATRELERLNIREKSAVSRIDGWCQPDS